MRAISAITRSGRSTPSAVTKRCSVKTPSSLARMKRSTPHSRIVAMSEADVSTVARHYQDGLALGARGAWFEAHEAFETAWRACASDERDFFQGLVHVVVSSYQLGRGRTVATESQRHKAIRRLAAFTPSHRGLDVTALLAALERAEPDLREHLVEGDPQPPVAVEEEQQAERDEGHA